MNKTGIKCRLFGIDFISMAQAARYFDISHSYASELVQKGRHIEGPRPMTRAERQRAKEKEQANAATNKDNTL